MKKISMGLGIIGSLLLLVTFLFPIWSINLQAPQYPDGITMYIWINQITGETESTLQNINILNHYVGMKFIEPDSIPELTIFPYIIVFMTLLGVVFSILNKPTFYLIWVIMWVLLGIAGMYDFYMWEYDYGHNLNPNAPIKIEGQSYQPPLIGSEMLLNFKATSLPDIGSYFLGLGILFHLIAFILLVKLNKKINLHNARVAGLILISTIALISCSPQPEEIEYGKDECVYCKMTIVDEKFGAELVTQKGKVFKFDAIECMFDYIYDSEEVKNEFSFYLVNRFSEPKVLSDATSSYFLISQSIPSPMGGNLSAYKSTEEAKNKLGNNAGELYNWNEINEFFKSRYDKFRKSH